MPGAIHCGRRVAPAQRFAYDLDGARVVAPVARVRARARRARRARRRARCARRATARVDSDPVRSSSAAARARKLEDEQVRAAGAALDAIKPGGETARSGLGDGTKPFPAKTLDGGVGPNANDANAPADAAARNGYFRK